MRSLKTTAVFRLKSVYAMRVARTNIWSQQLLFSRSPACYLVTTKYEITNMRIWNFNEFVFIPRRKKIFLFLLSMTTKSVTSFYNIAQLLRVKSSFSSVRLFLSITDWWLLPRGVRCSLFHFLNNSNRFIVYSLESRLIFGTHDYNKLHFNYSTNNTYT